MSADGRSEYLVSVSKDRQIGLFRAQPGGEFGLAALVQAAHKRVIWSVSWAPPATSAALLYFATGGRDGAVRVWTVKPTETAGAEVVCVCTLPLFSAAVTAVAFAPCLHGGRAALAVGTEAGGISVWEIVPGAGDAPWTSASRADALLHVRAIRKLAWRPLPPGISAAPFSQEVASVSEDGAMRILTCRFD